MPKILTDPFKLHLAYNIPGRIGHDSKVDEIQILGRPKPPARDRMEECQCRLGGLDFFSPSDFWPCQSVGGQGTEMLHMRVPFFFRLLAPGVDDIAVLRGN